MGWYRINHEERTLFSLREKTDDASWLSTSERVCYENCGWRTIHQLRHETLTDIPGLPRMVDKEEREKEV